jgi:hypothetical protein
MLRAILFTSAIATAMLASPAQASGPYGPAPWCAVMNTGMNGVYWDCSYATAAECAPNVVAGNRGFCNPNPGYEGRASEDANLGCRVVRSHVRRHGRRVVITRRICR